jgi:hypothetical protein
MLKTYAKSLYFASPSLIFHLYRRLIGFILFSYFVNVYFPRSMLSLCLLLVCGMTDIDQSILHGQDQVLKITLFLVSISCVNKIKGVVEKNFLTMEESNLYCLFPSRTYQN